MATRTTGYILGGCAAASYGMNPLFALPLYAEGLSPDTVLFFRYFFAIPLLGIMLKARGRSFRIGKRDIIPLAVMGLLVALSSLTLFESYNYMNVGIASTLLFIYPILVALIMTAVFKERFTIQTAVCLAGASAGIAMLCIGEGGVVISITGTGLVFLSSLSYAIYMVGVNHSRLKNIATLKVTFYVLLFGLSLFIVRLYAGSGLHVPPLEKWQVWANFIALAIFPTAISFLCTTAAVKYIGSTPTAILGALEPVTAVFIGIAVFGESVTIRECIGFILVITSVSIVVAGGKITRYIMGIRKLFPRLPADRHKQGR